MYSGASVRATFIVATFLTLLGTLKGFDGLAEDELDVIRVVSSLKISCAPEAHSIGTFVLVGGAHHDVVKVKTGSFGVKAKLYDIRVKKSDQVIADDGVRNVALLKCNDAGPYIVVDTSCCASGRKASNPNWVPLTIAVQVFPDLIAIAFAVVVGVFPGLNRRCN